MIKMAKAVSLIGHKVINKIYQIRNKKVMLDVDLAE
jgi:hypothetical protein